ncbi:hypothetical protein BJV74DRAFT_813916 [Russula compacta]|nr:hypothetical protein BJV74DRAFT_813916 [Russula compacta]
MHHADAKFSAREPLQSPLSSTIWFLCTLILCTVYLPSIGINNETPPLFALPMGGVEGEVEKAASKGSSEIDSRIVEWTINALTFAEAIPGFYRSSVVKGLRRTLPIQVEGRILIPMRSFLDLSAPVKIRRLTICLNAAIECLLSSMPLGNWQGVPHSIEIAHFLTSWSKANPGQFPLLIRGINARILLSARERDGHWFALVMECLRVPERVLQDYLAHEDSLQLACLILFCRYALDAHYRVRGDLQPLCEIDICNTLPGLQHEFSTQNRGRYNKNPYDVVIQIRHLYASLHPGTDAAPTALTQPSSALFSDIRQHLSTYPSCNIPGHRYDLMPHNHGLSAAEAPYHSTAADYSTSSSTAISDLPSVLAAATSIPQPAFTPLSDSTIDLRPTGSTDHPPLSPSTVPRMSSSPSPTLPAIDTLPMDLRSFPPSSSQSNQGPSVSDTAVALNIEALGAPDDSRGLDDPTSCEAHSLSTSDGVICT